MLYFLIAVTLPSTGLTTGEPGTAPDVEAGRGRRLVAAVAGHEVVLDAAAAGEDVAELLAEVAARRGGRRPA